jgi:cyclophilin family peptidyl-prolyl cis-trans isomerase
MLGSCTTSHPEVEMQIAFNGKTYTLEYTLYRKFAPNTVTHFLQLAENGYYDGLCVHDYADNKLYTGGYTYDEGKAEDGGLVYKSYYDEVKKIENYEHSVWADTEKQVPTYTLYGEFSANNVKVQNGAFLKQEFGSLTMYYSDKTAGEDSVIVEKIDGTGTDTKEYRYNSATSLFYINLNESALTSSEFCTFALLQEDSKAALLALQEAIDEYIEDNYGEDDNGSFTVSHTMITGEGDKLLGDAAEKSVVYNVPQSKIVIESIKMNKY